MMNKIKIKQPVKSIRTCTKNIKWTHIKAVALKRDEIVVLDVLDMLDWLEWIVDFGE